MNPQERLAGWEPIETAPKDGTRIRLGHEQDLGSLKDVGISKVFGDWTGTSWGLSSYFIIPGGRYGLMSNSPTHWKPAPPPPPVAVEEGSNGPEGTLS